MKILLDENRNIVSYATLGDIEGSVEVNLPEDIFQLPCCFYRYENGVISLDIEKIRKVRNQQLNEEKIKEKQKEISTLETWFEYYDNQINQYERCVRLGLEFDNNVQELDNEAAEKQLKIRELRNEIKELQEL